MTSSYEVDQLGERIDRAWKKLGHKEMANYAQKAAQDYQNLWEELYYESMP